MSSERFKTAPLLLKLGKYRHVLPSHSCNQEQNTKQYARNMRYRMTYIPQKDGSKFAVFKRPKKFYDENEMCRFLVMAEVHVGIYKHDNSTETILPQADGACGGGSLVCYRTHSFLNGDRIIPCVVDKVGGYFWDVSYTMKELIPEDGWGVLVEDVSVIENKLGMKAFTIDYLSSVRLCKCCGIVSDTSLPLKAPFMRYKAVRRSMDKGTNNKGFGAIKLIED